MSVRSFRSRAHPGGGGRGGLRVRRDYLLAYLVFRYHRGLQIGRINYRAPNGDVDRYHGNS
uniref:hypothetical protein n=1 Tax=Nocardia brasiliensis TaxID=37326 RepID=UPI002458D5BC